AVSVADHRGGALREADDAVLLTAAGEEARVLVTYDLHTIPALLTVWAHLGVSHAGVIFVHAQTIRQGDRGGQIRALLEFAERARGFEWTNRCEYLRRVSQE